MTTWILTIPKHSRLNFVFFICDLFCCLSFSFYHCLSMVQVMLVWCCLFVLLSMTFYLIYLFHFIFVYQWFKGAYSDAVFCLWLFIYFFYFIFFLLIFFILSLLINGSNDASLMLSFCFFVFDFLSIFSISSFFC